MLNHLQINHHGDCILQDEGDGTFSVIAYQEGGANRCVVVSKRTPQAIPEASTATSDSSTATIEGKRRQAGVPDAPLLGNTSSKEAPKEPPPKGNLNLEMWQYLVSVICLYSKKALPELQQQCIDALRAIMASKRLARLLQLPKQREISWVANASPREFNTTGQVKAMLIQITGIEPAVPCSEVSSSQSSRVTLPFGSLITFWCGFFARELSSASLFP